MKKEDCFNLVHIFSILFLVYLTLYLNNKFITLVPSLAFVLILKHFKKKGKKAQAAMEFLTTYGWAIIIFIVVVVALASLGVFRSPDTPNSCIASAPIGCTDVKLDEGGNINLELTTNFVSSAKIIEISLTYPIQTSCVPNPNILRSSGTTNFDCNINYNPVKNQRFSGTAIVSYILSGSSQPHTTKVEFTGKVEPEDNIHSKAISFNGIDEACLRSPAVNLDLNGAEEITLFDDREFENAVINWRGNGNHIISHTTANPLFGTGSGLITATGVGSQSTNFVFLNAAPASLTPGKKYTVEVFANSDTPGTTLSVGFGDSGQTKTSSILPTSSSAKTVFNLLAGTNDINLRLWSNQPANIRIDNISITQAYDTLYLMWVEYHTDVTPENGNGGAFFVNSYYSAAPVQVFYRWFGDNRYFGIYLDDGASNTGGSNFVGSPDGIMHLVAVTFDRVNGIRGWVDANQRNTWSTANIGKILSNNLSIGSYQFTGKVGEVQMIRFQNGLPPDIATLIQDAYVNGIPQTWQDGEILLHYKWKGVTETEFLSDETGNNHLTCVNVNRQENQISVNYPLR